MDYQRIHDEFCEEWGSYIKKKGIYELYVSPNLLYPFPRQILFSNYLLSQLRYSGV